MPYCKEVELQTVRELTVEHVSSDELNPELNAYREILLESLDQFFEVNTFPMAFKSKKSLAIASLKAFKKFKKDLTQDRPDLDEKLIDNEKATICRKLALLFYAEYIEETLSSKLIPYCEENQPPARWGMGSVFYWDNAWGREFYSFWRNNIETAGEDTLFCDRIIKKLPEVWRQNYERQKELRVCPYKWGEMDDEEIVAVLVKLQKKTDPSCQKWGIGSIGASWDDGAENLWGKSFWAFWRDHVEKAGSEAFEARLLPHFPENWRGNFTNRETRDWLGMSYSEIAQLLQSLKRPHGYKKWGLGSIWSWVDPIDMAEIGTQFYQAWSKKFGKNSLKEFETHILPKLSRDLRETFMPVGFTIPFHETTDVDQAIAESTEDFDELHGLARRGNRVAFQKLCRLISLHFASLGTQIQIPKEMIERIVHLHLPVFGHLIQYASASLKIYSKFANRVLTSRVNDAISGGHPHSHHQDKEEDSLLENLEIKRLIEQLKESGISEQIIVEIFDALISGDDSDLTDEHQEALEVLKDLRAQRNKKPNPPPEKGVASGLPKSGHQ